MEGQLHVCNLASILPQISAIGDSMTRKLFNSTKGLIQISANMENMENMCIDVY